MYLFRYLQMPVGKLQSQLVVSQRAVGVAETPACPAFPHTVKQLLGNEQVALVVLDGRLKVPHQGVGVAQAVAGLGLQGSVPELFGNLQTFSEEGGG